VIYGLSLHSSVFYPAILGTLNLANLKANITKDAMRWPKDETTTTSALCSESGKTNHATSKKVEKPLVDIKIQGTHNFEGRGGFSYCHA
jgi:hypothetical protein